MYYQQGVIQKMFLGSSSTKKCDHDCDQALTKKQLRICIDYIYIVSELILLLHWGKFVNVK